MVRKAGSTDLPLHFGHVPRRLADRMTRLGGVMSEAIVHHYGRDEFPRCYLMVEAGKCFRSLLEKRTNSRYEVQDHLAVPRRECLRAASRHLHPRAVALAPPPCSPKSYSLPSMSKRSP
jgi:hypothetical protein